MPEQLLEQVKLSHSIVRFVLVYKKKKNGWLNVRRMTYSARYVATVCSRLQMFDFKVRIYCPTNLNKICCQRLWSYWVTLGP